MKCMTSALVAAAALLASCNFAAAQKAGSIRINVRASGRQQPASHVNNFKARIDARNTIAPDKTAFANWQITSRYRDGELRNKARFGAIDRTAERRRNRGSRPVMACRLR